MIIDRQKIQTQLAAIKPILAKQYPIYNMAFFGSAARNEATDTCDIDILVECNKPIAFQFFSLAKDLESYLQMPVDLVSRNGIKSVYFAAIEPDLIYV